MALNARERFSKSSWIECHHNHCLKMKVTNPNKLLLGDSIITALARYQNVWKKYFASLNAIIVTRNGKSPFLVTMMQLIWALEVIVLRMCSDEPSVYRYHRPYEI